MYARRLTAALALSGALLASACTAAPTQAPSAAPAAGEVVRTVSSHELGEAGTTATFRTSTKAPYKLYYVTLGNKAKAVARWNPCQTITYKVNLASVPKSKRTKALSATKTAVARMAKASGMRFAYKGSTSQVPQPGSNPAKQSAELVIAWTSPSKTRYPLGGWTAGYGGSNVQSWSETKNGKTVHGAAITRGYVVIDSPDALNTRTFSQSTGKGANVVNLLSHEIAHSLGLMHVNSATQLMNPSLSRSTPDGPAAGDRAGLTKVGRPAGCISVPSWVSTDLR